jgi:hypothetical protein
MRQFVRPVPSHDGIEGGSKTEYIGRGEMCLWVKWAPNWVICATLFGALYTHDRQNPGPLCGRKFGLTWEFVQAARF